MPLAYGLSSAHEPRRVGSAHGRSPSRCRRSAPSGRACRNGRASRCRAGSAKGRTEAAARRCDRSRLHVRCPGWSARPMSSMRRAELPCSSVEALQHRLAGRQRLVLVGREIDVELRGQWRPASPRSAPRRLAFRVDGGLRLDNGHAARGGAHIESPHLRSTQPPDAVARHPRVNLGCPGAERRSCRYSCRSFWYAALRGTARIDRGLAPYTAILYRGMHQQPQVNAGASSSCW